MNNPEGFRGYQGLDRSGIMPEPKDTNSNSSVARREVGSVEKTGLSDKIKKLARRVGTLGLATIMLSGPMASEVQAEESPTDGVQPEVTDTVIVSPEPTTVAEVLGSDVDLEPSPTRGYKEWQDIMDECRVEEVADGCLEKNLGYCSRLLALVRNAGEIQDSHYEHPENTNPANFVTEEDIKAFGRGEYVPKISDNTIYFKDENGNLTDIPALLYIPASDRNLGIETVQSAIDLLDVNNPGSCLKYLYESGIVSLMQGNADDDVNGNSKYLRGMIYLNYAQSNYDLAPNHDMVVDLAYVIPGEGYGYRCLSLDEVYAAQSAYLKEYIASKCANYAFAVTGNLFYEDLRDYNDAVLDTYREMIGGSSAPTDDELEETFRKLVDNGWITPWGANSWEEIESVKSAKG